MEKKVEEITVDISRGHILQIGDKYFKLSKEDKDEDGRTIIRQVYKEIDPETYLITLKNLAHRLREVSSVKLVDVIFDALKDLPLERLARLEDELIKAREPPHQSIVRTGGCIELKIGNEHLVLRE